MYEEFESKIISKYTILMRDEFLVEPYNFSVNSYHFDEELKVLYNNVCKR